VVDAGNALVLPKMTYEGTFAATGVTLTFENLEKHAEGAFFEATNLIGQFGAASGLRGMQIVTYHGNQAKISVGGLIITIR
jgi:hypothetical protein